ncbi:MAG: DUF3570 domain-containing protein [Steroidobacteraceae bacterium]
MTFAAALILLLQPSLSRAGVLPEDRADVLYHRYDGGGVVIDGPSVLVRKKFFDKVSVAGNYYIDMVSSASVDVLSSASPYDEERTQKSLSLDYLRGKSTYSIGYIDSAESDYKAKTYYASISQDMFGDLTTVSFGFKRGSNDVFRNIKDSSGVRLRDPNFAEQVDTRSYSVGLTQILTRNMIAAAAFETITDEGYLNSPYRSIRFLDGAGFRLAPEVYPRTRTSNAGSIRLKYHLPYRAAVDGMYRFYSDTWGIVGHTGEIGYTHPWRNFIFEASYRYYTQTSADFYRDLFPRQNTLNFQARDKELASFVSQTAGFGASYEFRIGRAPWLKKTSVNFRYDHILIDYDNFRDITQTGFAPGAEPLYSLNANVFQVFFSAWF